MKTSELYHEVANYLDGLERFGIKPGLERIRAIMEQFENPHLKFPVVLVGGTNGKGSVVEFIATILRAAGYNAGIYTSPHIYRYNERIRVLEGTPRSPLDGANDPPSVGDLFPGQISDGELSNLLNRVRTVAENISVTTALGQSTTFEILTAMAFLHFAESDVDVAVIEVGMGGRWDATNVTEPIVSVITNVSLDHTDRLGNTVEDIAREKVEIIRPRAALIHGELNPDVVSIFRQRCNEIGTECQTPEAEVRFLSIVFDYCLPEYPVFSWRIESYESRLEGSREGSFGEFQQANIALAISVAIHLKRYGWNIDRKHVERVLKDSKTPCRFEFICSSVIADSANNPAGMRRLSDSITRYREELLSEFSKRLSRDHEMPKVDVILVLGISADKDIEGMIAAIAPTARAIVATQGKNPRAAQAELIADVARKYCDDVRIAVPVMDAVSCALSLAKCDDLVCITGSIVSLLCEVDRQELAHLGRKRESEQRNMHPDMSG